MERGGLSRGYRRVAISGLALLLTLALPRVPETKLFVPDPLEPLVEPPLLEMEGRYPSSLRTALELESRYAVVEAPPAPLPSQPEPRGAIALTFDTEIPRGGEARQTVNEILDVLRHENVRATFFVVGTWARANAEVLRRIADEGHEIANHSFDHRAFARRSAGDLRQDLARVAELVQRETGKPIAPLFRPPYGCLDAVAARLVRQQGYALVGWTAAGADALGETASPLEVVASLERNLDPGAVVLLHTNRWITAAALPRVLDAARQRQLEAVPLSEMLEREQTSRPELERLASRPCGSLMAIGRDGSLRRKS